MNGRGNESPSHIYSPAAAAVVLVVWEFGCKFYMRYVLRTLDVGLVDGGLWSLLSYMQNPNTQTTKYKTLHSFSLLVKFKVEPFQRRSNVNTRKMDEI